MLFSTGGSDLRVWLVGSIVDSYYCHQSFDAVAIVVFAINFLAKAVLHLFRMLPMFVPSVVTDAVVVVFCCCAVVSIRSDLHSAERLAIAATALTVVDGEVGADRDV